VDGRGLALELVRLTGGRQRDRGCKQRGAGLSVQLHYPGCRPGVNSCPDSLTNLDNRLLAALDQSGLSAFLPRSGKLAHQVPSARARGLERAPVGPTIAPPPCVRAHLHAGLACFIGVSLHRLLPSRMYLNRACRTPSGPLPALACTRGRTSPFLYMCSTLSHIGQVVKCFGMSWRKWCYHAVVAVLPTAMPS